MRVTGPNASVLPVETKMGTTAGIFGRTQFPVPQNTGALTQARQLQANAQVNQAPP
jgi:hypothetical protein